MTELEPYDKILCKISIRPEFCGRKARPEVVSALNGKTMLMQVMFCMDEGEKYPNEWVLVPYGRQEYDDMIKVTGWIASGDVEILEQKNQRTDKQGPGPKSTK